MNFSIWGELPATFLPSVGGTSLVAFRSLWLYCLYLNNRPAAPTPIKYMCCVVLCCVVLCCVVLCCVVLC